MGRVALEYLDGRAYVCCGCKAHLALHSDVINNAFHGRLGRAYLFETAVNLTRGPTEDRILMTGLHTVRDVFCTQCHIALGWTYDEAFEESQKYKEGKFVLEKTRITASWR